MWPFNKKEYTVQQIQREIESLTAMIVNTAKRCGDERPNMRKPETIRSILRDNATWIEKRRLRKMKSRISWAIEENRKEYDKLNSGTRATWIECVQCLRKI